MFYHLTSFHGLHCCYTGVLNSWRGGCGSTMFTTPPVSARDPRDLQTPVLEIRSLEVRGQGWEWKIYASKNPEGSDFWTLILLVDKFQGALEQKTSVADSGSTVTFRTRTKKLGSKREIKGMRARRGGGGGETEWTTAGGRRGNVRRGERGRDVCKRQSLVSCRRY